MQSRGAGPGRSYQGWGVRGGWGDCEGRGRLKREVEEENGKRNQECNAVQGCSLTQKGRKPLELHHLEAGQSLPFRYSLPSINLII